MSKRSEETKAKYQGVFIAAQVPMNADYSLNLGQIGPCIQYLIDAGMATGNAVYVALGAGGEHMELTKEERKSVAEAAVKTAAGRLPIFVGVSEQSTKVAVELAEHAELIGADGLQVEPPWYFTGTSDDTFEYFRAISESVSLGITAYNTPWTSGFDMDRNFVDRLTNLDNVVGLKWFNHDVGELIHVLEHYGDRFSIVNNYCGVFNATLFILGARGYVSQAANFIPRTNLRILNYLRQKKFEEGTNLYMQSEWEYYNALFGVINQGLTGEANFIKACMPLVGLDCGPARLPLRTPPTWFRDRIRDMVEKVKELRLAVP